MTEETQAPRRGQEITINSDWVTTVLVIAALPVCAWLLARDIEKMFWGHLVGPTYIQPSFWNIWNKVFEAIAAFLSILLSFKLSQKAARIACGLMGTRLASFVLLSCFNISPNARHIAAVSGSIISQIALVTCCVAIVQWLTSAVGCNPPQEPQGGGL